MPSYGVGVSVATEVFNTCSLEACKETLTAVGLKATQQRLVLYQALCQSQQHPDADSLFQQLKGQHPSLSLATVYRVLDTFVATGICARFVDDEGKLRFDANLAPHHHLICEATNQIIDFDDPELNQLLADYFTRKPLQHFKPRSIQLHVHGTQVHPNA